jgi:hypothetical protein
VYGLFKKTKLQEMKAKFKYGILIRFFLECHLLIAVCFLLSAQLNLFMSTSEFISDITSFILGLSVVLFLGLSIKLILKDEKF